MTDDPTIAAADSNRLSRVLGSDSLNATDPDLRYRDESDVIGAVETSPNGENTILRVGSQAVGQKIWFSGLAHVVLTNAERDTLVAAMLGDRAVARIFQALAHEARRLDNLEPKWRDEAEVEFTRDLRNRFAAVHPEPADAAVPTHTHTTTEAGELLDADGSHCVRCRCAQCTEPADE